MCLSLYTSYWCGASQGNSDRKATGPFTLPSSGRSSCVQLHGKASSWPCRAGPRAGLKAVRDGPGLLLAPPLALLALVLLTSCQRQVATASPHMHCWTRCHSSTRANHEKAFWIQHSSGWFSCWPNRNQKHWKRAASGCQSLNLTLLFRGCMTLGKKSLKSLGHWFLHLQSRDKNTHFIAWLWWWNMLLYGKKAFWAVPTYHKISINDDSNTASNIHTRHSRIVGY